MGSFLELLWKLDCIKMFHYIFWCWATLKVLILVTGRLTTVVVVIHITATLFIFFCSIWAFEKLCSFCYYCYIRNSLLICHALRRKKSCEVLRRFKLHLSISLVLMYIQMTKPSDNTTHKYLDELMGSCSKLSIFILISQVHDHLWISFFP